MPPQAPALAVLDPNATVSTAERCDNCRFGFNAGEQLICRLKPPTLQTVPVPASPDPRGLVDPRHPRGMPPGMMLVPRLMSLYPAVVADSWCGEYMSGKTQ